MALALDYFDYVTSFSFSSCIWRRPEYPKAKARDKKLETLSAKSVLKTHRHTTLINNANPLKTRRMGLYDVKNGIKSAPN